MAGQLVDRCLIVAPHPDDETIGAGNWMHRHRDTRITVVHVTDGSPSGTDAGYAHTRRHELLEALYLVGIKPEQLRRFALIDKQCHLHLPELTERMVSLVDQVQPEVVMSPAYEGGHPDHDAAAFAVALARHHVRRPFRHVEYRLYHAGPDGSMVTEEFLPSSNPVEIYRMTEAEQAAKRRMLAVFRTQQHMLRQFGVSDEHFREAPAYDFTRPPHEGKLMYQVWGWNIPTPLYQRL